MRSPSESKKNATIKYDNGNIYEGEIQNNMRNGTGITSKWMVPRRTSFEAKGQKFRPTTTSLIQFFVWLITELASDIPEGKKQDQELWTYLSEPGKNILLFFQEYIDRKVWMVNGEWWMVNGEDSILPTTKSK